MNNVWVLSVKTSLPGVCFNSNDTTTTFTAYESFEEARDALRDVLKNYAFSQNAMFDGNGGMTRLGNYVNIMDPDEVNDDDEVLTKDILSAIYEAFKLVFEGHDIVVESLDEDYYHDGLIYMEYFVDGVAIGSHNEHGPKNRYLPDVNTNMFSMREEKDYYLYIVDHFGQNEDPAVLFIDLKKTAVL